ncbi:hypothetical protein [Streptomyces sp. NPDC058424]|uniref:hypothetical protein n=1 Tax=Streptomyces sp. NPDC058424 TaxID=3346491 RepID=UPI003654B6E9
MTALNPHIGYTAATEVAAAALATGRSIPALVVERGLLTEGQVALMLRPEALVGTAGTESTGALGRLTRLVSARPSRRVSRGPVQHVPDPGGDGVSAGQQRVRAFRGTEPQARP